MLPLNAGDAPTEAFIRNALRGARSLHSNFYEDRDSERDVLLGLTQCEELTQRLYDLFWQEGATC